MADRREQIKNDINKELVNLSQRSFLHYLDTTNYIEHLINKFEISTKIEDAFNNEIVTFYNLSNRVYIKTFKELIKALKIDESVVNDLFYNFDKDSFNKEIRNKSTSKVLYNISEGHYHTKESKMLLHSNYLDLGFVDEDNYLSNSFADSINGLTFIIYTNCSMKMLNGLLQV